jgi:hypothetical protein
MSEAIERETQDLLRQQVIRATSAAAKANNVSVHADAVALVSQPELFFVNAPIAGIEKLDFKAMLDGSCVLDNTPVMYWYVSYGAIGDDNMPIPEGFYTVIAHASRGTVSLRDTKGTAIAAGNLGISIEPHDQPSETIAMSVSGGVDSVKIGKRSLKMCGHVTVSVGSAHVTIEACIDVHV